MKLGGRVITSPRKVIDINRLNPSSLGELGDVYWEKLEKLRYFQLTNG